MVRILLLTTAFIGVVFCSHAFGQDTTAKLRSLLETRNLAGKPAHEPPGKDKKSSDLALKEAELSIQLFQFNDMFTYLQENKGKVPLYSTLQGKLQLELGVFGYVGVKWRF
jgi:hypothetical protein